MTEGGWVGAPVLGLDGENGAGSGERGDYKEREGPKKQEKKREKKKTNGGAPEDRPSDNWPLYTVCGYESVAGSDRHTREQQASEGALLLFLFLLLLLPLFTALLPT